MLYGTSEHITDNNYIWIIETLWSVKNTSILNDFKKSKKEISHARNVIIIFKQDQNQSLHRRNGRAALKLFKCSNRTSVFKDFS